MKDWRPFFPEESVRPIQGRVLDLVTSEWEKYDNFCLELPTGAGKSAIAVTLARWLGDNGNQEDTNQFQPHSTYITTTSIELQHQYEDNYKLSKLYSADNFKCKHRPCTCSEGKRVDGILHNRGKKRVCSPDTCNYSVAKSQFIKSPYGVLNLAYYLNETYYAGQLIPRGLHIFDEAHSVADTVQDFVTLSISQNELFKYQLLMPRPDLPNKSFSVSYICNWLKEYYLKRAEDYYTYLGGQIEELQDIKQVSILSLISEYEHLDKKLCRVRRLLVTIDRDRWVIELLDNELIFTPLIPKPFMRELLYGRCSKNILMSATLLNTDWFMEENDLDPSRTRIHTMDSPFLASNRPIYYYPAGKLQYDDLRQSMKPLAAAVKEILVEHPNDRGIIFVSSYKQARELIFQVNSPRLITHDSSKDKKKMMDSHLKSPNSVIVSPSMHEGVDLKDDISRFQIILKIPFPSLGAKSVSERAKEYPTWYSYVSCLLLVQSTGRSVRSETDRAFTYILDENFGWFFQKNKSMFPGYWKDALIML